MMIKSKKDVASYLGGSDGNTLFRKQGEDCIENAVKLGQLILSLWQQKLYSYQQQGSNGKLLKNTC